MDYEVSLLLKLVSINTTSTERRGYNEIIDLLVEEAEKMGLFAEKIIDDEGIPQVLISMPDTPKEAKKIIFLTHYDVVPAGEGWNFDPFKPFIKSGKLFGRGSADDKSNIAAAIAAFSEALKEGLQLKVSPILVVVGGEETGESEEFLEALEGGDLGIVLDVGCKVLSIGASGSVRLIVNVKGKQAHSAYPFKGKNAIYKAAKIIGFLEKKGKEFEENILSRFPASTHYGRLPRRINVTTVNGGVAENVIPGECRLTVDVRTIPEESAEKVADEISKMLEIFARQNGIDIEVQVKSFSNGWVTDKEEVIEKMRRVLEEVAGKLKVGTELGGTDGRYLIEKMPVIQYGTIRRDTNFHGKNEFVYLDDMKTLKKFIKKVITNYW